MGRAVLQACLPWLGLLLASLLCIYLLVQLNQTRMYWGRLRHLHGDQLGSAQTLSFVLTLPFFVMIMLFIVQVSQLMIATMVVHYAAYAGARAAVVWIPAEMTGTEGPNCINAHFPDPDAADQVFPILDPADPNYGPAAGGTTYVIDPGGAKYDKIASAAVISGMSISPSRNVGVALPAEGAEADAIIRAAYGAMVPGSGENSMIPVRLRNKLAYSLENTEVEARFFHKNAEPPLVTYYLPPDPGQFYFNELGWQDTITVTVRHNLALLPGPGRLLARPVTGPDGSADEVSEAIGRVGSVYVYPLRASAMMGSEGERSVIRYVHN